MLGGQRGTDAGLSGPLRPVALSTPIELEELEKLLTADYQCE